MNTATGKYLILLVFLLAVPAGATIATFDVTYPGTYEGPAAYAQYVFYNASISGTPISYTIPNGGVATAIGWSSWIHAIDYNAQFNLSYAGRNYSTVTAMLIPGAYNTAFNFTGGYVGQDATIYYHFDWVDPDITSLPGTVCFEVKGIYDNLTGLTYTGAAISSFNHTLNLTRNLGMAMQQNTPYGTMYASDGVYEFQYSGGTAPSANATLSGYTNNAYSGAVISSVSVFAAQGTHIGSDSSSATGAYYIEGLIDDLEAIVSAAKPGYTAPSFAFTPNAGTDYVANISLVPDYVPNSTAVIGIVYRDYDHDPISGATVTLENATWSDTYTSTMTGFYIFDNLPAGETYDVSATATGYTASSTYPVTTVADVTTQQDIELGSQFAVTVTAKDGGTGAIIQGQPVYFECSDGQTANSTFGTTVFTVAGGVFTFTATTAGYTVGQQQASITSDSSVTLLLYNTTATEPAAIRYIPHTVRLVFVNQLGLPIPSAHVTASTSESSSPTNWLLELFGIPSAVSMNTTTLSGTTDSAGSISFAMADVLKYDILIYNSTAGFSKNFTLYPKEDQYTFQINLEPVVSNLYDVVKWNLSSYDYSATQISMNLTYNDSAALTTSLVFYVNGSLNLTPIYTKTVTLTNGNGSAGYVVTNTKGDSLSWGFIAQNSRFGTITDMMGLTMKGVAARLIETGWTSDLYLWTSYLILFVVAALFSYANIRFGAIILPFVAGGLWWIGWLSISWVLLGSLIALGTLVYINRSEVKTR